MGNPVIFVHGIGASANVWKKFEIPEHPVYFISFSDRYANPASLVPELARYINEVIGETKSEKVILVCHSMGGLVARKYLVDFKEFHRVDKLILLSTPNLGSIGLSFNWLPITFIAIGLFGFIYIWPWLFTLIGLIWEFISYLHGILLLSQATWSMRPKSRFLRDLNSKELPVDVKYVVIFSITEDLPHHLVNIFLFWEDGDGAVPLSSQRLSPRCVPNFDQLNYTEFVIDLPHFAIPKRAEKAVLQAIA
jgi:pimeloyl-ACP methyl ester carboxylesterase